MNFFKLAIYSVISAWLISRGAATDQNWLFVLIGLGLWLRQVRKLSISLTIQITFVIWFLVALFALDWLRVLGIDAWLALATFVSAIWAISMFLWRKYIYRDHLLLDSLSLASGVVCIEYLLAHQPLGGFNWLRIGYLWSSAPFVEIAYLFGISALSFVAIFIAVYLFSPDRKLTGLFTLAFVLFVLVISTRLITPPTSTETFNVLAIQGSVPRIGLDFNAQRAAVFQNHASQTETALNDLNENQSPQLILWPENASDIDPYLNLDVRNSLLDISSKANIPILFGAVLDNSDSLANAAMLATDTKLETVYIKQKLVPFGEYLPFRNLLAPLISRFDRLSRDFVAGSTSIPVAVDGSQINVLICYEVAFDQVWRNIARESDLSLVITNNATYGETKQPIQQLRITQLQAIAAGRGVVVASTSGISAEISSSGEIKQIISENQPGAIYAEIPRGFNVAPSYYLQSMLHFFSIAYLSVLALIRIRSRFRKKSTS